MGKFTAPPPTLPKKELYRTYDCFKAGAKVRELQDRTGVKWDHYAAHGGYVIQPVVDWQKIWDAEAADRLLPYLTDEYKGFLTLARESGMPLDAVIRGAWTLTKRLQALPSVNRNAKFNGCKRYNRPGGES